jgi:hypothetical protein
MPTLPGGVTPPIGTLPPEGVTPGLPGGVTPPIGTLPPEGVTPGLPGGVTPPIGTLPPEGVTPGLPGGVTPPIGTLPPEGVTPKPPEALPPGVPARAGAEQLQAADPLRFCVEPNTADNKPTDDQDFGRPFCPRDENEVPLTEGRDLLADSPWNIWSELRLLDIEDERHDLDLDTLLGSLAFGVDRRLGDNLVLGASISVDRSNTAGFEGSLRSEAEGISAGPYLAILLSPHWAVDGSLTYGRFETDLHLAILDGEYASNRLSGSASLRGQYDVNGFLLRPTATVTYSRTESDRYGMEGDILGRPVDVMFPEDRFNSGMVEATTEISRIFVFDRIQIMPFAELGLQYEFERPDDGRILAGDLSFEETSALTFTTRAGFQMAVNDSFRLEAAGGYLSFNQPGLDVWEAKLNLSYGF